RTRRQPGRPRQRWPAARETGSCTAQRSCRRTGSHKRRSNRSDSSGPPGWKRHQRWAGGSPGRRRCRSAE
ncbi:DUF2892 domain-containing protein, partial [Dysosmobacter welbionis]